MLLDSPLLALIVIAFGAVIFTSFFFLPRLRSREEIGVAPIYEERCTVRKSLGLGFFGGGNIPLWRVSFYDRFMVIAFVLRSSIPYKEIERVECKRHFLSKGVYIHQRSDGKRSVITLFPRHPDKVMEILSSRVKMNV